jgi:hypothetical protein
VAEAAGVPRTARSCRAVPSLVVGRDLGRGRRPRAPATRATGVAEGTDRPLRKLILLLPANGFAGQRRSPGPPRAGRGPRPAAR